MRWKMVTTLLLLGSAGQVSVEAQNARDTLRLGIEAFEDFREEEAIALLRLGLNPRGGQPDSVWIAGLHVFVQLLLDRGEDEQAGTWLRWAWRTVPQLRADERQPPHVIDAFNMARDMVENSAVGDAMTITGWDWGSDTDLGSMGGVRVASDDMTEQLTVLVQGIGVIPPEGTLRVRAGTYTLSASAAGYETADAVREVLPGVTTAVRFRLLETEPGVLYVASEPWGVVYVDGARLGYTTIVAHPLRSGIHRLRIQQEGYITFDTTITISRAQRLRLGTVRLRQRGNQP